MKKPTKQQIEQLRLDLQKAVGDHYQVQIIKTAHFTGIWLVVITYPQESLGSFLEQANSVSRLHWKRVDPITKDRGYLRVMYTCQESFVLYTPHRTDLFQQKAAAKNKVVVESAGAETTDSHHYYGSCDNIQELLQFITQTRRLCF